MPETNKRSAIRRALVRLGRSILSILAAHYAGKLAHSPYGIALAPVLQAAGKYVREKRPELAPYVPF